MGREISFRKIKLRETENLRIYVTALLFSLEPQREYKYRGTRKKYYEKNVIKMWI